MKNFLFKEAIAVSLLGHLTFFSIFNFSFGNKIPEADLNSVSFLGQFIGNLSFAPAPRNNFFIFDQARLKSPLPRPEAVSLSVMKDYYLKPPALLVTPCQKGPMKAIAVTALPRRARPAAIVFHPVLPYSFSLYFKDRQVAHVELIYRLQPEGGQGSIAVKRKISSGNLEVDLLSMRYIRRYLFIQQAAKNDWQTVKIDLSAKE